MASGRQQIRDARKRGVEVVPSRIASAGPVFKTPPPEGLAPSAEPKPNLMSKVRKKAKKVLKGKG